ncbi:MAG: hypothetical protein ACLR23_10450 [Clostridia bacterium]
MIVGVASNLITMIFCLGYLLSNSLAAFLASVGVVLVNCGISFLTSQIAKRYWEKNRDVQDTYFRQMTDLVQGFKELLLNWKRKMAFWSEMKTYSRLSADLSKTASIKFLNFQLYNTLMYNIIFGVVVFLFPIFIIGIQTNDLRETLFMVFYLIGPFGSLMNTIPAITRRSESTSTGFESCRNSLMRRGKRSGPLNQAHCHSWKYQENSVCTMWYMSMRTMIIKGTH